MEFVDVEFVDVEFVDVEFVDNIKSVCAKIGDRPKDITSNSKIKIFN